MATTVHGLAQELKESTIVADFVHWLRTHHGAITMAALLSYAVPITFFVGNLGVMREPTPAMVIELVLWYLLYGFAQSCLVLVIGYALQRSKLPGRYTRGAAWLFGACVAAAVANLSTEGRAGILIEQGIVDSVRTMHLYAFTSALIMALLFFAYLQRSRAHEEAAARLAAAQAAHRESRRRLVHARLQALQARVDPQLLFDMLDAVRRSYADDASRAEQLLDELIAFLRAALPRLRTASSSVSREADLASAYMRLRALASATEIGMTMRVSSGLSGARFPPGVLLPLLDEALSARLGPCELEAKRSAGACRLELMLPARPSNVAVSRVRLLLAELYGTSAALEMDDLDGAVRVTVTVPHELA
jgi:Histidine kinase